METHGLTKRFGSNVAVDDVELLVPRGGGGGGGARKRQTSPESDAARLRVRYLGPNGAGKTTLIRTLLGLTRANSGTMSLLATPSRPSGAGLWPGSALSLTSPASTRT